jgi:tetratricopeptide (TPR) repeat protein
LILAGRYDEAVEQYHKALMIDPDFAIGHIFLGQAYLRNRMADQAIEEIQRAVTLSGSSLARANLAYAYAVSGKKERANEVLRELLESSKKGYMSPFVISIIYAGLGDEEGVLAWLEKAREEHHSIPTNLFFIIPLLDNLPPDPRHVALLKQMGLELGR